MSCTKVNLTEEQARNIYKNKGLLFRITPQTTRDEIRGFFKYMNDNLILHQSLTEEGKSWYTFFGTEVRNRVSDLAHQSFKKRKGIKEAISIDNKPDVLRKKALGTHIHNTTGKLVDLIANNKGDINSIRKEFFSGKFIFDPAHFEVLHQLALSLVTQIEDIQSKIDPNEKADILVEQKILDPISDRGGAMDVFALFSDKSGAVYDFKSHTSWSATFNGRELTDNLLEDSTISDYNLSMSEYMRIVKERFGITHLRQNRLIPIHVRLNPKDTLDTKDNDYLSNTVAVVEAGDYMSPHLAQVPLTGEETKYAGLNDLIEKQWALRSKLSKKLNTGKLTMAQKERLKLKIAQLNKAIQNTIIKADISDIMLSMHSLVAEASTRLLEPQKIVNTREDNPKYLDDRELEELYHEALVYKDIIDNTQSYFKDLKQESEEYYNKLKTELLTVSAQVLNILSNLKQERETRILSIIPDEYKTKSGSLMSLPELNWITRTFGRISDIDHPIFKSGWSLIQKELNSVRQYVKQVDDDLAQVEQDLFKWAKQNNMSRQEAFNKIINFENGSLIYKTNQKLRDEINKAYDLDSETSPEVLKGLLEIRDKEQYKKYLEERFEKMKINMRYKYGNDEQGYLKAMKSWIANNDLLESNQAWSKRHNRIYLRIKPEVENANLSDEYKYVQANKPLLDYYNLYIKYNNEFRRLLQITKYYDLPPNFIPNIRKEFSDYISREKGGILGTLQEFRDSFRVREEDVYLADLDESGDFRRTIPILFLNPLRNKNGEIDLTQKSYDLSSSLLAFAKVAKNYEVMHKIEPKILGLREILRNPSSEQMGTEVHTKSGAKIKGRVKEIATKSGLTSDTAQLFEDLTDYYLYGIKFKEENLATSVNVTKVLLKLKQYHAKRALSFAIIPSAGALVAGRTAAFFEGRKGIAYTNQHMQNAYKYMVTDYKKFKAASLFFDVYAEDPVERMVFKRSIRRLSKTIDPRTLFMPLRKVDEHINDVILVAMLQNYGLDENGNYVRLNRSINKNKDIKSLWELMQVDEKTGKITIEGITEDAFLGFRAAVKSTSANIIGSLSQESISRIDTSLIFNLMMAFKSWMPGIVRERTGDLIFDDDVQAVRWGRYKAAFSEIGLTKAERISGYKLSTFITSILLPNLAKASLDLITFGLGPRLGMLGDTYTTPEGKVKHVRTNLQRAMRRYQEWIIKNPELEDKVTFEDFLETKEGQIRAMLVELRTIMSFLAMILMLGSDADDGEPRYMDTWFTRTLYKVLTKGQSELTFMWNPDELMKLIQNPFPLASLLASTKKTFLNTFDETRDLILGENSPYDKSPLFYYTLQWAYGGVQLERFFEIYEEFQKSPYTSGSR